jgi:serine/threonine-protein kinase
LRRGARAGAAGFETFPAGAFAALAFLAGAFFSGARGAGTFLPDDFRAGAFAAGFGALFPGAFGAGFAGAFLLGFFVAMVSVGKASPGGASSATWTNRPPRPPGGRDIGVPPASANVEPNPGERLKPQEPKTLEPLPVCGTCGHPHLPGEPCTSARMAGAGTGTLAMEPAAAGGEELRSTDPLVGSTVGSFRVVRALGRGGMGTVYLAEHPVIGSRVAIKFLHESMAASPELVARFYDEARAVNRIGHENIVGIFDLSMLPPNRYYIVMEYLDGDALSALLRRGAMPVGEAVTILLQLCDALQCAHERGVVHRDLKPDNVFVARRRGAPFVKLLDFGIAKLRDAPPGAQTAAGMIVGTPEYMAPEQCENRPVDARTDVYALGVMAYQMFAGVLPFAGSITQLLLAHVHEAPRPPRSVNGSLSPALDDAVLRALRKRPEDRFPDMASFAEALASGREAAAPVAQGSPPTPNRASLRVQLAGEPQARSFPAAEITRGGVYLESGPPLPAPFSRAVVSVPDGGSGSAPVPAEVVRVVQPAEAKAWGMAAGFALQFLPATPAERAALERLAGGTPAASRAEPSDTAAAALLDALETHSGGSHYEFLGLPLDAELKEVQSRARALRVQLENLRGRKLSPRHAARVAPLLARVAFAADVIGVASERLAYDARSGNHLGVARCIASGLPEALVAQRRQEFLRERPGSEERVRQCLSRAKVARAVGNLPFARAQYEEALAADPLDLDIHREYWALRRDLEGPTR